MEILGAHLEEILNGENEDFNVVNKHYKFIGCDHDLWEFQAILYRVSDDTFYSVNWYDNYACNWHELGLLEEVFELDKVTAQNVITTVYT